MLTILNPDGTTSYNPARERDEVRAAQAMQKGRFAPSFEELCEKGRIASDALDSGRWILGELAATVETHYGESNIEQFAIQVAVEKARMWEYKRVYSFYEKFAGANYRSENPMLRYSHYRDAMRLGDEQQAMDFLGTLRLWLARREKPTAVEIERWCEEVRSHIVTEKG